MTCPQCQATFEPRPRWGSRQKYCSRRCRKLRWNPRRAELAKEWRDRKGRECVCARCKKTFVSKSQRGSRCCSAACYSKEWYWDKEKKVDPQLDIATIPHLAPYVRLAMRVIEQAKDDIVNFHDKLGELNPDDDSDAYKMWSYHTAYHFLFEENPYLEFWCLCAGWKCDSVRENAERLLKGQ